MNVKDIYINNARMYRLSPNEASGFGFNKSISPTNTDSEDNIMFYIPGNVRISLTMTSLTTAANKVTCTIADDDGNTLITATRDITKTSPQYIEFDSVEITPFKKYTITASSTYDNITVNARIDGYMTLLPEIIFE